MEVRFTFKALEDLEAIYRHIAQESPGVATSVATRIREAAASLEAFSDRGRVLSHQQPVTRELLVKGLPYALRYFASDGVLYVFRVKDQRQAD